MCWELLKKLHDRYESAYMNGSVYLKHGDVMRVGNSLQEAVPRKIMRSTHKLAEGKISTEAILYIMLRFLIQDLVWA